MLRKNIHISQLNSLIGCTIPNGSAKICTQCWEDKPYIRFYWNFHHYITCHEHQLKMMPFLSFGEGSGNGSTCDASSDSNIESHFLRSVLVRSIEIYSKKDNAIESVELQMKQYLYEKETVSWVCEFFRAEFGVSLDHQNTQFLIDSADLVGLPVFRKMDNIISALLIGNPSFERRVRVIFALRVLNCARDIEHRRTQIPAPGYEEWATSEVMSIDDLLYAYIGFGALPGYPYFYKIRYEIRGFENLHQSMDRQLCLGIFSYRPKWTYEADKDVHNYQQQMRGQKAKGNVGTLKYNEYLKSQGKSVLDNLYFEQEAIINIQDEVEEGVNS